jgi:hypothetical protein
MPRHELLRLEGLRGVRRKRRRQLLHLLHARPCARLKAMRAVAKRMRMLQQVRLQVQLLLLLQL